jgi:hypothetical protein
MTNSNLQCKKCGSVSFKVNTVRDEVGRVYLAELECDECAADQIPVEGQIAKRHLKTVKATTYEERVAERDE